MPRVAFIGNFSVPFSTEAHHAWTFENRLGWEVTRLQENRTTTDEVIAACRGAQLLSWTHTHGYSFGGTVTQEEMVKRVREMGVPSYSYHLDVYFGLDQLDRRETNLGKHPSFRLDYFFSTDGNHEMEYKARGVNHHWLLPGLVEYGAYLGELQSILSSEIGFVGSIGYHPEYPFRTRMVAELKQRYGSRFRTYVGMREKALNNVYASSKILVGDHCFAGMPRYCSDRLFETTGRGGFLIYPETTDVTNLIPGLVTYKPQDMNDLCTKVDYFLDPAHEKERTARRNEAHEWVKANGTYTQRLQEILRVLEIQ